MTGISYGIGTPTSYVGQTFPGTSPFGGYGFAAHPFGPQAQQYVHPLQQQQVLQQLQQTVPQQLLQLLHVLPQQVNLLQNAQQQVYNLQQLLQILPQQLHQLQHIVQSLSHHLLQQPFSATPQSLGTIQWPNAAAFGAGLSQQTAGPWGFTASAPGVQPFAYPQTAGIPTQNFGFGAQPTQFM